MPHSALVTLRRGGKQIAAANKAVAGRGEFAEVAEHVDEAVEPQAEAGGNRAGGRSGQP